MSKVFTEEEIRKDVEEKNVRFLRLAFTDINGTLKNLEVPVSQLDDDFGHQTRFDGSSIDGFVRLEEADMVLYPDLATCQFCHGRLLKKALSAAWSAQSTT